MISIRADASSKHTLTVRATCRLRRHVRQYFPPAGPGSCSEACKVLATSGSPFPMPKKAAAPPADDSRGDRWTQDGLTSPQSLASSALVATT
jgi:hypothetical protein